MDETDSTTHCTAASADEDEGPAADADKPPESGKPPVAASPAATALVDRLEVQRLPGAGGRVPDIDEQWLQDRLLAAVAHVAHPVDRITVALPDALERYVLDNQGKIQTDTHVVRIDVDAKRLIDSEGNEYAYDFLIWAADLKSLYRAVRLDSIRDTKLIASIESRIKELAPLRGGDSIFTVYLSVDLPLEYFEAICTGHFFYTPSKLGLSRLDTPWMDQFLEMDVDATQAGRIKEELKKYLDNRGNKLF